MTKPIERFQRYSLYTTLTLLAAFPTYFYIHEFDTIYSKLTCTFILVFTVLSLSYFTLCLCYRGYVTLDQSLKLAVGKNIKTCPICMDLRPERAHHCSTCKRCIKKMDHHCHWLGRCVNYDNQGHFIRFLFFTFCNAFALLLFNSYYIYLITFTDSTKITYLKAAVLMISTMLSILILIVSFMNLNTQLYFVVKNITFIEKFHCKNYNVSPEKSPYNLGLLYNVQDVLGPFYLFLLGMPSGNGIFFEKKSNVSYWPKHNGFSNEMYSESL